MFHCKIICLGKFKDAAHQQLEAEYTKRLAQFAKLEIIEIPEEPYFDESQIEQVKQKEAEKIIQRLPEKNSLVILLSEKGLLRNSVEFSKFVDRITTLGQTIVFVIGSGVGLHDSLKEYANYEIALSTMTFTHTMTRILLEEQLYRACMILSGRAYHKA